MFEPLNQQNQMDIRLSQNLISVIDKDETEDNLVELKSLVRVIGKKLNVPAIMEFTTANGKEAWNIYPASIAIMRGKLKFFEIIIDECPQVICAHYFHSAGVSNIDGWGFSSLPGKQIDAESPLKVAMIKRLPDLVNAVLRNKHFINHAFDYPKEHLPHLNYCIGKAKEWYAGSMTNDEKEILRMLQEIKTFRTTLIFMMIYGNLKKVNTALSHIQFIEHGFTTPKDHSAYIEDCIGLAQRKCSEQTGILNTLENVLIYKLPILSAMKVAVDQGDCSQFNTILSSLDFINFGIEFPDTHKAIVEDCIKCARKWCESQPEILGGLDRAIMGIGR
jgi:hypothetical protein